MSSNHSDGRRTDTTDKVAELLRKGMTVLEIARLLNISPAAVYRQIHRHGLKLPSEAEKVS
jgi:DNA-binding NarL/FixJ family response regulator